MINGFIFENCYHICIGNWITLLPWPCKYIILIPTVYSTMATLHVPWLRATIQLFWLNLITTDSHWRHSPLIKARKEKSCTTWKRTWCLTSIGMGFSSMYIIDPRPINIVLVLVSSNECNEYPHPSLDLIIFFLSLFLSTFLTSGAYGVDQDHTGNSFILEWNKNLRLTH